MASRKSLDPLCRDGLDPLEREASPHPHAAAAGRPAVPWTLVALARARAGLGARTVSGGDGCEPMVPVSPDRPAFQASDATSALSYRRWYEPIPRLAAALRAHDVNTGDRVILFGQTRLEWFQADLAIAEAGGLSVPVHPSLPAAQIEEILTDSGARAAFVSSRVLLEELLQAPSCADLRILVVMPGDAGGAAVASGANGDGGEADPRVIPWEEALRQGGAADPSILRRLEAVRSGLKPEDPVTVIYTSGTTGRVKGVVLTHANLLSSAVTSARAMEIGPSDVYLSYLPLSHVLERVAHLSMLWAGALVCYGRGLDQLEKDFRRVRPTVVVGVPRLYEKILLDAEEKAKRLGAVAHLAFRMAKRAAHKAGRRAPGSSPRGLSGRLYDAVVYRRVRSALGGRARCLISGGAPLGRRELLFLNGAGLPLLEGYGLTETSSVLAVNTLRAWRAGSVGRPLAGMTVRLAADGEILARGPSVMPGYYANRSATAEALREGWLYTGDLGRLDADGFLYVTGRKKELIVLAGGKKVAPQIVEGALRRCALLCEAVVVGDRRPYLTALLFPDLARLRARTGLMLPESPDLVEQLNSKAVRAVLRTEIDRCCSDLAPHEVIRDFHVLPAVPTVSDGGMTATLKIRRAEIERRHQETIAALYRRPRA